MISANAPSLAEVPIKISRRRIPLASEPRKYQRLDFFLKIAESCNIACTYCYYYFGGDDSHASNPRYISAGAAELCSLLSVAPHLHRHAYAVIEQINSQYQQPLTRRKTAEQPKLRTAP